MRISFLGTGTSQGVPVIGCDCETCLSIDYKDKRLRSSIHVETDNISVIIDIGPDFRQQVLRANIKWLDAVLLTHEHKDHTAGLDDIRSFNFKQKMDMPIYGRPNVLEQLKQEFAYIFSAKKYPGVPSVLLKEINGDTFHLNEQAIQPIEVKHYKLPVFGFRFDDFAYITDAKTIDEEQLAKLNGLEVLVLNALQHKPHISHLTLAEALELAAKIGAKQTYLTHISHNLGMSREVEPTLPEGVSLAFDGLQLNL